MLVDGLLLASPASVLCRRHSPLRVETGHPDSRWSGDPAPVLATLSRSSGYARPCGIM